MEKHLKPKQYYIDLYDRHTVERCRRTEKIWKEKDLPPFEGRKFSEEERSRMGSILMKLYLHFETGERYLNKEKTIREWMETDQKTDSLYELAEAPEDIRCLTCRNLLKPTFKELWSETNKPDRVLFMYDCPNKCLPHRAFFSDGEEWRMKPNLCPRCDTKLDQEAINSKEKIVTKYICSKCGYTKTDEFKLTHEKEDLLDESFAFDRDRFCITEEDGKKYQSERFQMEQMAKFMEEWEEKEKAREEKLKENPQGFHLEGAGYTCPICSQSTPEGDNWYDQWGIKCLVCQKAIDNGEILASLAKDKESWYSSYDLESRFDIKSPTWRKWIRDGVVKARTVSYYGKDVHTRIFLIEDNKDFFPPKNLTEPHSVKEMRDGQEWCGLEPWYKFVDPKEYLKGYGIVEYIKISELKK